MVMVSSDAIASLLSMLPEVHINRIVHQHICEKLTAEHAA